MPQHRKNGSQTLHEQHEIFRYLSADIRRKKTFDDIDIQINYTSPIGYSDKHIFIVDVV